MTLSSGVVRARLLPDVARQRLARHHLALVAQQVLEQLELAHGQLHGLAAARHLARDQVHVEIADAEAGRLRRAARAAPAPGSAPAAPQTRTA